MKRSFRYDGPNRVIVVYLFNFLFCLQMGSSTIHMETILDQVLTWKHNSQTELSREEAFTRKTEKLI